MPASKGATRDPFPDPDAGIKSDLAKVDAHEITQEEYDEIPELTDEMIARAEFWEGGRFVRVGPPGTPQDRPVLIALPAEVVDHFRRGGPGWQARVDAVLLDVVRRERAAKGEG